MKPLRICIKDFMCYNYSDIDCTQFNSVVILGKSKNNDRESNGVGKTTIFRAIEYALFSAVPGKSINKVIRQNTTSCKVEFEFESNSNIYRITRSHSIKSGKLKPDIKLEEKINDTWRDITQRTVSETELEINKIIKINHKAFQNSILFAQADMSGLASASAEKRRQILKEPLQLAVYSKLESISKKRVNETIKKLDFTRGVISSLGDPESDIEKISEDIDKNNKTLQAKRQSLKNSQETLSQKRSEYSDLERMMSGDDAAAHQKLSEIRYKKRSIEQDINNVNVKINNGKSKLDQLKSEIDKKILEAKKLDSKLIELEEVKLRDSLIVKKELNEVSEKELSEYKLLAAKESRLKELNQFLLPTSDHCPYCLQNISTEHRDRCDKKLKEDIANELSLVNKYKDSLRQIKLKKENLSKELQEISDHEKLLLSLRSKLNSLKEILKSDKDVIKSYSDIVDKNKNDLLSLKESLSTLIEREKSIQDSIKNFSIDDINRKALIAKNEIESLERTISALTSEISHISSVGGALNERLNSRKADLVKYSNLKKEQLELEYKAKIQQHVVRAFSSSGIPSLIINTILDDLQIESNNLLSQLRPGIEIQFFVDKEKDGEIEDTLGIKYIINGQERDYELLSGGQQAYIAISLKIGLSRVIQNRIGVNIQFLQLDEVDKFLDEAGVDALLDIIKKIHDKFKIFLITHNKTLKEKFSHAILVENDGDNGSSAKVVTSW